MSPGCHPVQVPTADWGWDLPEYEFFPGQLTAPLSALEAHDLPEVLQAAEQGFEPAPEAPVWCYLPAVWPPEARAWVRDRSTYYLTETCVGQEPRRRPWSFFEHFDFEEDTNRLLAECGVSARPTGRLWLLRPPDGYEAVAQVLGFLFDSAVVDGLDATASSAMVLHVVTDLGTLFAGDVR